MQHSPVRGAVRFALAGLAAAAAWVAYSLLAPRLEEVAGVALLAAFLHAYLASLFASGALGAALMGQWSERSPHSAFRYPGRIRCCVFGLGFVLSGALSLFALLSMETIAEGRGEFGGHLLEAVGWGVTSYVPAAVAGTSFGRNWSVLASVGLLAGGGLGLPLQLLSLELSHGPAVVLAGVGGTILPFVLSGTAWGRHLAGSP